MDKYFYVVSLGCAKNFVDTEVMIGGLENQGWVLAENPEDAQVLLLNTCGFIQPAVEEAIDETLELAEYKKEDPNKYLVVTGCVVQRYKESLIEELPEVDLFLGTEAVADVAFNIEKMISSMGTSKIFTPERMLMTSKMPRRLSTPFYRSWMKITEGCDNRCSYCMIPSIRGNLRSRELVDLVEEGKQIESLGVKEVSLIAQDLTAYGDDLGDETDLANLLNKILKATSIPWIRLLYLYPTGITEELIELMATNNRIVPYLDIPFQHSSESVLNRMNRDYNQDDLYSMIEKLRTNIPEISLRTTFLVGFPGETEKDFESLKNFVKEAQLDHLGVFGYTNEAGAPSENYDNQISDELKQERVEQLLSLQSEISKKRLERYVGSVQPVLVEGVSKESDLLLEGRTRFQAPDIDGCVYINEGEVNQGDIVNVEITESQIYDLVGRVVK